MMSVLNNKTVVITRSKEQSAEFIFSLKKLGATPILLPLIQIEAIHQAELKSIHQHQQFDWVIFTSHNAVHTFFESIDPSSVNSKVAVVGSKTAETLQKHNLNPAFIPSQFTAAILAQEIPVLKGETVLVPQSVLSKNDLVTLLEKRGALVFPVKTYQNTPVRYDQERLTEIFSQQIDFITFTSGSAAKYFADLNIPLKNANIVCIGPETAKVAQEHNIKVAAIATPHTVEGITEAIVELLFNDSL